MSIELAKLIPWIAVAGAAACGLCATRRAWRPAAGVLAVLAVGGAFVLSVLAGRAALAAGDSGPLTLWTWIAAGGLNAAMGYRVDGLTVVMLMVVTGIGTLVTLYATGYMAGDRGYARFFAFVCLFIFSMTSLVLADNLVLLYLGWEGVGLCSYLLIGFHYQKPSAVAAAKKAFIVNRIGDLGFALGIFLVFARYHTVNLHDVLATARATTASGVDTWIPFLLMLGAFGKSAQIPLYVWLPDAMEGPTPVSALIHAATMVTAGVYLIARLTPLFALSPWALPTVAIIGAATAIFAATIALCQYDIKRIYAYSTISQLGYMFLGVGVAAAGAGLFHLFTHAFFKALLFLTAGNVMHGMAGQLDLRKMSGLGRKMPITAALMLVGCLALAGFPFLAGFYSKDLILAAVMQRGLDPGDPRHALYLALAIVGLVTAFLTAFYTFRVWFRVFVGPAHYEMGQEHAGADAAPGPEAGHADPARPTAPAGISVIHHHEPHEANWLMNGPLVVLALGAIAAGWRHGWGVPELAGGAAAHAGAEAHHASLFGLELHTAMMVLSAVVAVGGIASAAYFHWFRRSAADRLAGLYPGVVRLLENKYYVDEVYDALVVRPLRALGMVCYLLDRLVIDGLVALAGLAPRLLGLGIQPAQQGLLQGYGLGMVAGIAVIALLVFWTVLR